MNSSCVAPNEPVAQSVVESQRVYPKRQFAAPLLALQAPADASQWYVVEKAGVVRRFATADLNGSSSEVFLDIRDRVNAEPNEAGLLGMAFDPDYASNGRVFLSYTARAAVPSGLVSRLARFTRNSAGNLDVASERVLLSVEQPFDNHNGGNLAFGPDGKLYIGFGDGGSGGDPQGNSQNLRTLLGKMLRIDVAHDEPYSIPSDNPYAGNALCAAGSGAASCPEIYARGLRNPWRWSFDRAATTPQLWLGDVGQDTREEIDRIERGGNYGWNLREGTACYRSCATTAADGSVLSDPIFDYGRSDGYSVTGGYVYRGTALAGLAGDYVFGDFGSAQVWALHADSAGHYQRRKLLSVSGALASFAQDADGELYWVDLSGGALNRFVARDAGSSSGGVAAQLSGTGCFDPVNQKPVTGLIPYEPNAGFWSDGAAKERWMALPDGAKIDVDAEGDFNFPKGSVLVKNFRLQGKLVETRLLMRYADTGNWGGYSYQWNTSQNEAALVNGGLVAVVQGQSWVYPSSAQCLQCHTVAAGHTLGLEQKQLNGSFHYAQTGRDANQLTTLGSIGLFSAAQPDPAGLLSLPTPFGSAPLAQRARAYLHANCAQCHREGGPTPSSLDLRFAVAIADTHSCDVSPSAGDLGIPGARLIVPGDPARSLLVARMNRRDAAQMPPLASTVIDSAGVTLISDWIRSMDTRCG